MRVRFLLILHTSSGGSANERTKSIVVAIGTQTRPRLYPSWPRNYEADVYWPTCNSAQPEAELFAGPSRSLVSLFQFGPDRSRTHPLPPPSPPPFSPPSLPSLCILPPQFSRIHPAPASSASSRFLALGRERFIKPTGNSFSLSLFLSCALSRGNPEGEKKEDRLASLNLEHLRRRGCLNLNVLT